MLLTSLGSVPRRCIEERLALVRARIAQLQRELKVAGGAVHVATPQLRELQDEEAFLAVLIS
jgi:hypothetical protein